MKLDIEEIIDLEDGSCRIVFELDEVTKTALVSYAIKHILIEEAKKVIKENETK